MSKMPLYLIKKRKILLGEAGIKLGIECTNLEENTLSTKA